MIRLTHKLVAGACSAALVVGVTGPARADNVTNDVASTAGGKILSVQAGSTATVAYNVLNVNMRNGDTENSCNLSGTDSLLITPTDLPTGVTAPAVTVVDCDDPKNIVFSVAGTTATGDHVITHTLTKSTGDTGSYSSFVDFTLRVTAAAAANTAPTTPGAPTLSGGSSPNNTGHFALEWAASTDAQGDAITYTVEHRDTDDASWSEVATGITSTTYAFGPGNAEPEGTWTYRVKASDATLSSPFSAPSSGIVVDLTAPNAPTATADRDPDYDGTGPDDWFRDTVTVSFAGNGDSALGDGSDGSGVDTATIPAAVTKNDSGTYLVQGMVKDLATNESAVGGITVKVDASKPTVEATCPTSPVIKGSTAAAGWAAADDHSGLATPATGSVTLDTSAVGANKTATVAAGTAQDRVGLESDAATCTYSVIFAWTGFFSPVDSLPTQNTVKAGSAVPVKFSLGGDQGLAILAPGYPTSNVAECNAAAGDDTVEETSTAGNSSLSYDASTGRYNYVWKTDKLWAGQCRQLRVKLIDGTVHAANFRLTK